MSIANHILRLSSAQIPRWQLDLAITVLMLHDSDLDISLAYDGLRKKRYEIDHRFIVELLKSTRDSKAQWAIVRSPAFAHLPEQVYRRLFSRFWRLRRAGARWRYVLGWSLHLFLQSNPQEGLFYAKPIWRIANDPDETVALSGLANIPFMGKTLTLNQAQTLVALSHHASERALAAMSSLGSLYRDIKSLKPEVRAFLLDSRTMATLRNANPRDGRGKWSCHRWCLTNMRKASGRAPAGRVPAAGRSAPAHRG